jgi:hypothetical protein
VKTVADRTKNLDDADASLEHAISAVLVAYDLIPEHFVITDFLLTVEAQDMDSDTDAQEYAHMMRGGRMRASVAIGLCDIAKQGFLRDIISAEE